MAAEPCAFTAEQHGPLSYALKQWDHLLVFLEDGRVELDNNLVENTIRPSAIGKKNYLFIGDAGAGVRAALRFIRWWACQHIGVDAYAYLQELFAKLPTMTNQRRTSHPKPGLNEELAE